MAGCFNVVHAVLQVIISKGLTVKSLIHKPVYAKDRSMNHLFFSLICSDLLWYSDFKIALDFLTAWYI